MADFEPCDALCLEQKRRAALAFMGIHLGIGSFDDSYSVGILYRHIAEIYEQHKGHYGKRRIAAILGWNQKSNTIDEVNR
ncbi:hypothetical protein, partial [Neisseria sicca]|uniref:hypothetical protein n=1 Tax=Neisseria sicca TaxID=490 RepID=UPI0036076271